MEHLNNFSLIQIKNTIHELELLREYYIHWDTTHYSIKEAEGWKDKKDVWWQIIQLLPSSYNQTRNVMLNYEVLANMYHSRKNHKLDEWRDFCKWVESLPYSELIINENNL